MSPTEPNASDNDTAAAQNPDGTKPQEGQGDQKAAGPFQMLFPPDISVWHEARKLVGDGNARVDDLAACCGQDPVIVMELLKSSNAMYFSAGRQPITLTKTALVRLGSETVVDTLEKMRERPQIEEKEVSHWFEIHRSRCRRTSLVARIIAESHAKTLSDECQVVGSFLHVGEMLAVMCFPDKYVRLAEELARSGVNYRLAQDFKFDVERMGLQYLRRNGIPEAILFAIDREGGRSKSADRAVMKPVVLAAGELVEAFDSNRWDKFAPGKQLPPKSAVRMLGMGESQYLKVYERASEYLFSSRVMDENKRRAANEAASQPQQASTISFQSPQAPQAEPAPSPSGMTLEEEALQSEINSLLHSEPEVEPQPEPAPSVPQPVQAEAGPAKDESPAARVAAKISIKEEAGRKSEGDQFSLKPETKEKKTSARRGGGQKVIDPPKLVSRNGAAVVTSIADVLNSATNSEQLISQILAMLVDGGPFKKTALIVVSKDRSQAIVVAARGPNIGNGQRFDLDDPLSPLAQCFSKVQSFGNKKSKTSPFGSRSFAVAPIDADHETPVALYADCGNEGSISFEARRVFRTVVDILNQKLPDIPGGIPIEIS